METRNQSVLVATLSCQASVPVVHTYHRSAPECVAEGFTILLAAQSLVVQLTRSLDHHRDHERRLRIEQAISDARAFVLSHSHAPELSALGA